MTPSAYPWVSSEVPVWLSVIRLLRFQSYVNCQGTWNWIRYLTVFFTETGNCIVKTTGRYPVLITPCSICQSTLSAFNHQIHPFFQGSPWSTFATHNETSNCSKFLSPIKRSCSKNLSTIIIMSSKMQLVKLYKI